MAYAIVNAVSVLINDSSWPAPPPPIVRINDVTVTEGNVGSVNVTFTVTLSGPINASITTGTGIGTILNDD